MIWVIGGCFAVGAGLCILSFIAAYSRNPDTRSAAPFYFLPGAVLVAVAAVVAIVNAAVQALLP